MIDVQCEGDCGKTFKMEILDVEDRKHFLCSECETRKVAEKSAGTPRHRFEYKRYIMPKMLDKGVESLNSLGYEGWEVITIYDGVALLKRGYVE